MILARRIPNYHCFYSRLNVLLPTHHHHHHYHPGQNQRQYRPPRQVSEVSSVDI